MNANEMSIKRSVERTKQRGEMMDNVTQELSELAESKAMYDKWLNELSKAESEPLIIKNGTIVSGVLWIGLTQKPGKVRRKPVGKASTLQSWAMKYANINFNYAS